MLKAPWKIKSPIQVNTIGNSYTKIAPNHEPEIDPNPPESIDPPPPPQEPNQKHFLFTVMSQEHGVQYMEPDQIMNQGLNKFKETNDLQCCMETNNLHLL